MTNQQVGEIKLRFSISLRRSFLELQPRLRYVARNTFAVTIEFSKIIEAAAMAEISSMTVRGNCLCYPICFFQRSTKLKTQPSAVGVKGCIGGTLWNPLLRIQRRIGNAGGFALRIECESGKDIAPSLRRIPIQRCLDARKLWLRRL